MRKRTCEKDRHNKKLKKNPVSTYEFMVGASNELHKEASCSLEKEEKKEKKRRKGSQDKSKPSPKYLDTVEKKSDKKVDYCT